jgi:CRISPR-associated protein Cas1
MWRIVDISSEDQHIGLKQNHIIISVNRSEIGRIFLPDVCAVLINSNRATMSKNIIIACAEHGVPIVYCDKKYIPVSISLPVSGHYHITKRIRDQTSAKNVVRKRLWQQVVRRKISEQARTLLVLNPIVSASLIKLAKSVRSGDPENREAQAARLYWPALFGKGFTRDRKKAGLNAGLNYGYTIIRSAMSRAVVAAGLLPSYGLHHHNNLNAFCLVDDLMEPYRPLVDRVVYSNLDLFDCHSLGRDEKILLSNIINWPLLLNGEQVSIQSSMQTTALSLVRVFEGSRPKIEFANKLEVEKQTALGI